VVLGLMAAPWHAFAAFQENGPHGTVAVVVIGVGLVLGLRAQQRPSRVVVLVGDAELDEGSNHEAIALAGRLGLDGLTVVVVDNRSATYGWPGGIGARFEVEGWAAAFVDGRDHEALAAALSADHGDRPNVVVAAVEKGS
jgi:transketolase